DIKEVADDWEKIGLYDKRDAAKYLSEYLLKIHRMWCFNKKLDKKDDKTFIIYTDEGNLVLSQADILNTIDVDLELMDNQEERTWCVVRKDMTEEEKNNLSEL
ncbi:MAG: hypothetical protein ACYDBX_03840, partial [Patescibacteria group bacterium]